MKHATPFVQQRGGLSLSSTASKHFVTSTNILRKTLQSGFVCKFSCFHHQTHILIEGPRARMSANMVCLCGSEFSTQAMLDLHARDKGHFLRCSCHRLFATLRDVQKHEQDTHPSSTGNINFLARSRNPSPSPAPTSRHICHTCNRTLANEDGLVMHRQAKYPSCPICKESFDSSDQLEGHQRATLHCYCAEHSLMFASAAQHRNHDRGLLHATFGCISCERTFHTDEGLLHHLSSVGHSNVERVVQAQAAADARASSNTRAGFATPDEEANLRCDDCLHRRRFKTVKALRQHKRSVKHNPLSDLRCPMSDQCTQVFTSPSALLFHLEGGRCKSGMTRAKVDMLVHQHDTGRQITASANLLTVVAAAAAATTASLGSNTDLASRFNAISIQRGSRVSGRVTDVSDAGDTTSNNDHGVPILTPTASIRSYSSSDSSGGDATPTQSSRATSEWSFINHRNNSARILPPAAYGSSSASSSTVMGTATEQQILSCPVCDKSFQKHNSLVKHLESTAHAKELYHCPTGLALPAGRHSTKSFKTMSGILQHLEAGACVGGRAALDQIFGLLQTKIAQVTGTNVRLLRDGAEY